MRSGQCRQIRNCGLPLGVALGLLATLLVPLAYADDQTIRLNSSPASPHFEWLDKDLSLENKSSGHDLKLYVKVPGKFSVPDSVVVDDDRKIALDKDGGFELLVPVSGARTTKTIRAVTPLGVVETQSLLITVEPWGEVRDREVALLYTTGRVATSLGITSVTFLQSNLIDPFKQTNLTLKLAYAYPLSPPRWELGLNAFSTVLPITHTGNTAAYYVGANARIGYAIPGIKDPWHLALHTGLYYATVISQNNTVGYQNFGGPQIFPALSVRVSPRNVLGTYVKLAAVANGLSLSFPGHETAAGLNWTHALMHERAMTYSFDYSVLTATIPVTNDAGVTTSTRDLRNTSATFSVGYAW